MQFQAKVTDKNRHMKDRTDNCRWKPTGADKHAQVVASHKPASSILHAVKISLHLLYSLHFIQHLVSLPVTGLLIHRASSVQEVSLPVGFPDHRASRPRASHVQWASHPLDHVHRASHALGLPDHWASQALGIPCSQGLPATGSP